jgi:hypothetical protein
MRMTIDQSPPKLDKPEQSKKPYRAPKLSQYGNVRDITRVGGTVGMNDGSGKDKTAP